MTNYRELYEQQYQRDLNLRTEIDVAVQAQDDYTLLAILRRFAVRVMAVVVGRILGEFANPVIQLAADLFYSITRRSPPRVR